MFQDELQNLKNNYSKKYPENKKYELNYYQIAIIILIIIIMIIFIIYKIGYIYLFNKNNIPEKIETNFSNNYIIENNFSNDNYINKNEENQNNNYVKIDNNIEDLLISRSFSKNLEDLILNVFFNDIKNGFYIDIGDFIPNEMSVTKYFYLKGWNGINIKPFNEQFKKLTNKRPKDINIYYNISGKYSKKYTFHDFNKKYISFYTISDILHEYIPKKKDIHFCKIDLKDDTRKILLGYDFDNYGPKLFCIENNNTYQSFDYILYKNNYSFIYQYELNSYYINNQYKDLKERVDYIDEIIKTYKNKIKEE